MIRVIPVTSGWVIHRFEVMKDVVEKSEGIWAVYDGETLCFVIGAVRLSLSGTTRVWLHAVKMNVRVLKRCRAMIQEMKRRYHVLVAFARPGQDQRFAEWCGFRPVGQFEEQVRLEL